ncbi:MAG: hypothetical protein V1781_06030 [Bacteroidota bacterium]
MKKIILCMALAFGSSGAFAQDLTSKRGEPFLPAADDWAISFDAAPFLNYVGYIFGKDTNVSPGAMWVNPGTMTITGKLFLDETTAIRGIVRLGLNSWKETRLIKDASVVATYPATPPMKEDLHKRSTNAIGLGAGIEKRRGKVRLQGFYGAEAMIWKSGQKDKFEYGNVLSTGTPAIGVVANTSNFGNTATADRSNITIDPYNNIARVIEYKAGSTFGFSVRGFIGAEYFIFPKIAIGAEYGYGIGISKTGAGTQIVESIGGAPPTIGKITTTTGKASHFGIDNDINGGTGSGTFSLKLTLHF